MYRGTTPTNTFRTGDLDLSTADAVYITYKQRGKVIAEKTKADCTFGENSVSVTLTQEDTLNFSESDVLIQIRARFPDGRAVASNIIETPALAILKEGVI